MNSEKERRTYFIDGRGKRADQKGSGFAWIDLSSGRSRVDWVDGLTNNEAEYRALLAALDDAPQGTSIRVITDSQLVCEQMKGNYRVTRPELRKLRDAAVARIEEKQLGFEIDWLPGASNPADDLLRKPKPAAVGA